MKTRISAVALLSILISGSPTLAFSAQAPIIFQDAFSVLSQGSSAEIIWVDRRPPFDAKSTITLKVLPDRLDGALEPMATQFSLSLDAPEAGVSPEDIDKLDRNIDIAVSGALFRQLLQQSSTSLSSASLRLDQVTLASPTADHGGTRTAEAAVVRSAAGRPLNASGFVLASNGITILCPDASSGDTGVVGGVTYTKRTRGQITAANAATTCTSGITDMSFLFANQASFNQPIGHWDTSQVTTMYAMFFETSAFNQPIGDWNTQSVTTTEFMFAQALAFNQPLDDWDTSNVTNMEFMFVLSPFNQPIGSWDTGNVTNMRFMFLLASTFNQPIGQWNISQVTDLSGMFLEAASFNQPIGDWDTRQVTNMAAMFANAPAFNQPIGNWNTRAVERGPSIEDPRYSHLSNISFLFGMFANATAFNQNLSRWCVSRFNSTPPAFDGGAENWLLPRPDWGQACNDLFFLADNDTTVMCPTAQNGDSGVVNGVTYTKRTRAQITAQNAASACTSGIQDMAFMFADQGSFNEDISRWDTSSVTTMEGMFRSAVAFNGDIGAWDTSVVSTMDAMFQSAAAFNQDLSAWCVSSLSTQPANFDNAASRWTEPKPSWGSNCNPNFFIADNGVTVMCPNAERGDTAIIDGVPYTKRIRGDITTTNAAITCTSGITNFSALFQGADTFNQPIGHWDTSNAARMEFMFLNAEAFNQPIGHWDTSRVGNMAHMFKGATVFNQDIGAWNTAAVTNMDEMFLFARAFNQNIGAWQTGSVTRMWLMFADAASFNQPIGDWDTSSVTTMQSMFQSAVRFNQPIGNWNLSSVTFLSGMFMNAAAFNQDLTTWCVSRFKSKPSSFDVLADRWNSQNKPKWGASCNH